MDDVFGEILGDNILNIDTMGRDDTHVKEGVFAYEPTAYAVLDRMHERGLFRDSRLLIDYGCGKGRVPFYLAFYCKIPAIGVEAEEDFYCDAMRNARLFSEPDLVEFVNEKAEDYVIPDIADTFFFFHPFSGEVLEKVLSNIVFSVRKNPRIVRLILYYMTGEYIAVMQKHKEFQMVKKIDCRDLFKKKDMRDYIFVYELKY